MYLILSEKEKAYIHKIISKYKPGIDETMDEINDTEDYEARKVLTMKALDISRMLEKELSRYYRRLQKQRFNIIKKGGKDAILRNVEEQAPLLLENEIGRIKNLPPEQLERLAKSPEEQKQNGTIFIGDKIVLSSELAAIVLQNGLQMHINELKEDPEAVTTIYKILTKAIEESPYTDDGEIKAEFFVDPSRLELATIETLRPTKSIFDNTTFPIFHEKTLDALAILNNKDIQVFNETRTQRTGIYKTGDYTLSIANFDQLKGYSNVNTHKLLAAAVGEFTRRNGDNNNLVLTATIPFKEYARSLQYDIDERETDTTETAAKEKARASTATKNAKREIKKAGNFLQAMRWTWEDQGANYASISLIQAFSVDSNNINIKFAEDFAANLKKRGAQIQYHKGLFSISGNNPNAYRIGFKILEHYTMYKNHEGGNYNRLKVRTLLAVTDLPTAERLEAQNDKRHWERRVKDPFENALDSITGMDENAGNVITLWEYVKPGGERLPDDEAYNITDFETFKDILVHFEVLKPADVSEALAKRAEKKKLQAKEQKNSRKKAKK